MSHLSKASVFSATLWVLMAYGLSQLIRLVSNIFVSRLLEPEMFGIMAIIQSIMIGLEMFSDMGFWAYIVRHKDGNNVHLLNVVWTMQVVRGWLMFLIVTIIGLTMMFLNNYQPSILFGVYADDRLPVIICIVGLSAIMNGYKTMYAAVMSRDLKRGKIELVQLLAQIAGAIIMVSWAWVNPTIWALVSASLVSSFILLICSYLFFPIRHKMSWDKKIGHDIFQFGKWIIIASALTFISQQGDRIFFGAKLNAEILGIYSIAFMLATTVSTVVQQLSSKIVYPLLAGSVNTEITSVKNKYYQIRKRIDPAVFFVTGLLFFLSPTIIRILYDARYKDAGWMLQILLVSVIGSSLSSVSQECLSALGITKVQMKVMLLRTFCLLAGLTLGYELYGLHGAVWAVAINVWFGLPVIYLQLFNCRIFSFFGEIRMLPIVFIGYLTGYFLVELFQYRSFYVFPSIGSVSFGLR